MSSLLTGRNTDTALSPAKRHVLKRPTVWGMRKEVETLQIGSIGDRVGIKMISYIYRNLNFLIPRHYVRFSHDLRGFDMHEKTLQDLREVSGDNLCLVLYSSKEENDAYIIPVTELDEIFIPENLWPEVGTNIGRRRWKFFIQGDKFWLLRKSGSALPAATLDLSQFHNNYEMLGAECYAWEPFPSIEERNTLRPRLNTLF